MKNILCTLLIISASGTTAFAVEKLRLPASVNCDSSDTTNDLAELAYLLNIQKVLKQPRYEKMMNALNSVKTCEEANKTLLIAVGDCVLTDRKKKRTANSI